LKLYLSYFYISHVKEASQTSISLFDVYHTFTASAKLSTSNPKGIIQDSCSMSSSTKYHFFSEFPSDLKISLPKEFSL